MAPRTRLQAAPDRRVRYNTHSEAAHPRTAASALSKPTSATRINKVRPSSKAARQGGSGSEEQTPLPVLPQLPPNGATPNDAAPNRASRKKAAPVPKPAVKEAKPKTKTCAICAHHKGQSSFQPPKGITACQHFAEICRRCIERTVKGLMDRGQVSDDLLRCPYPSCPVVVPYAHVKDMISPGLFELWDKALLKRHIDADANVIACLSSTCGHWFSIEGWSDACKRAKKISCPYCKFEQCIACTRPWHKGRTCDSQEENQAEISEKARMKLGVKPCPKCGIEIKKEGGCDHMTCSKCGCHFCWLCLALNLDHVENCRAYRGREPNPPPVPPPAQGGGPGAGFEFPLGLMGRIENIFHLGPPMPFPHPEAGRAIANVNVQFDIVAARVDNDLGIAGAQLGRAREQIAQMNARLDVLTRPPPRGQPGGAP